jgi:glucosylceramidase
MKTRRQFIARLGALGAAFICGQTSALASRRPPSHVRAWRTGGLDRHKALSETDWSAMPFRKSGLTVKVDRTKQKQTIYGMGGALTDSSCYLISLLPELEKQELLDELFAPDGLGLSLCRICVGSSDFSKSLYSYDESEIPDPPLKKFSISHDRDYIIPCLKRAREVNPNLRLFATPWSPPGWMKSGGSMLGGMIKKRYFDAYADYLVRFLLAYREAGVCVDALSIQNEVDTDQDGRMPASLWGQEYEIQFLTDHLGPALRAADINVKIWILDHNYNLWGRVLDQLADPRFAQYVDGVAWHAYGGGPEAMSRVHVEFPDKGMYWTEGGPDVTDPNYLTDWCRWSEVFTGVLRNWSRSLITWNILLDENGKPRIGPFACGGLLTRNSDTGELSRSGEYWALAHFSKAIRPNAAIVESSLLGPHPATVGNIAFSNPGGMDGVILTNRGEDTCVAIESGDHRLKVYVPEDSIVTLMWDPML